jgi:arylsulfatase A-like enzyme
MERMTSYGAHLARLSRRTFLQVLAPAASQTALARPADLNRRLNIVFIMADDLGWRDTAVYGSRYYETPNIDRLASKGMLFTQAYAANPLCSPTRSSIMTGLYPARTGITMPSCHLPEEILEKQLVEKASNTQKALQARSLTRLKREYFTLAEALKQAGYATAHIGKWHLGREPYDPLNQGFDVDIPHTFEPGPVGRYLAPWSFWKNQGRQGDHIEDRMAEEAVKFIGQNRQRAFYLNYWPFSVHTPWNAKQDLIQKYIAKADLMNPQRNPVYAAMVQSLDEAVGRVVRGIEDAGVAEHTMIVFFSDNGGVHWGSAEEPSMLHADFQAVPATSNAPLRGGKATLYEGGTREPCIVVWPGQVKRGSRSEEIISSVDFYPTILEATGIKPQAGQEFDGISILPALRTGRLNREAIFCHFPHYTPRTGAVPATWVRKGDWKLIRMYCENSDQSDRFELYNLKVDIGELNNQAAQMPEKVRELNALINGFLQQTKALAPRPNPDYRRS